MLQQAYIRVSFNNLTRMSKMRIIVFEQLADRGIRYSRQHIHNMERQNRFPKRIQIGPNRVGWVEFEIDEWLRAKVNAREAA